MLLLLRSLKDHFLDLCTENFPQIMWLVLEMRKLYSFVANKTKLTQFVHEKKLPVLCVKQRKKRVHIIGLDGIQTLLVKDCLHKQTVLFFLVTLATAVLNHLGLDACNKKNFTEQAKMKCTEAKTDILNAVLNLWTNQHALIITN